MRVSGEFTTPGSGTALAALADRPDELAALATPADVTAGQDGALHALFTPLTPFGRLPLRTRIRTERADADGAVLAVHAARAQHAVDVRIELGFFAVGSGSRVSWSAEVTVRGPAALLPAGPGRGGRRSLGQGRQRRPAPRAERP